jgi:hypothetical protein
MTRPYAPLVNYKLCHAWPSDLALFWCCYLIAIECKILVLTLRGDTQEVKKCPKGCVRSFGTQLTKHVKTEIEQTSRLIGPYFRVPFSNLFSAKLYIYLTYRPDRVKPLETLHACMCLVFPQGQFNLKGNFVFDCLAESRCAFVAFADCVQGNHSHTQEKLVISQCCVSLGKWQPWESETRRCKRYILGCAY